MLATPLLRALRKSFPEAFIAVLVRPYTRDLMLHHPAVDEIIVDDPGGAHRGRTGFLGQVRELRRHRFDTALLLLPTERMAWMLWAAGIRTRVGVGMKLYEALTFMRTVSRHKYIPLRHEADYCLDLGRSIGAEPDGLDVELFLTTAERGAARTMLHERGWNASGGRLIGIHPGSGRSSPNWRIGRYAEFVSLLLRQKDIQVVLTGSPDERAYAETFRAEVPGRIIDLVGQLSLRELMAVIAHEQVLVSSSTGPMHIAAGLKVPTVSLFCPLTACSPELWGPRGNRSEVVLPPADYCATRCPGDPHICDLEGGTEPVTVLAALQRILPA